MTVRDSVARQMRRMGAPADMERVAPQWSKQYKDKRGADEYRVARIDVVATIPGRDELQWLEVTIRRPTAVAHVEGAARFGGFSATRRERKREILEQDEIGPDTVKPISFELGRRHGPQTTTVLQGLTAKLAEALGGELNAATALRKLRPTLERTLIRAEADALDATSANEEQAVLRTTLRETERGDECCGGW